MPFISWIASHLIILSFCRGYCFYVCLSSFFYSIDLKNLSYFFVDLATNHESESSKILCGLAEIHLLDNQLSALSRKQIKNRVTENKILINQNNRNNNYDDNNDDDIVDDDEMDNDNNNKHGRQRSNSSSTSSSSTSFQRNSQSINSDRNKNSKKSNNNYDDEINSKNNNLLEKSKNEHDNKYNDIYQNETEGIFLTGGMKSIHGKYIRSNHSVL